MLYKSAYSEGCGAHGGTERLRATTAQDMKGDLAQCMQSLKRHRACAEDGLVAEMLKVGGHDKIRAL
eukprot:2561791-Pyramimonas_sp.AAC.1